jgi:hypothetical protein
VFSFEANAAAGCIASLAAGAESKQKKKNLDIFRKYLDICLNI